MMNPADQKVADVVSPPNQDVDSPAIRCVDCRRRHFPVQIYMRKNDIHSTLLPLTNIWRHNWSSVGRLDISNGTTGTTYKINMIVRGV